jgi:hypothetical protein
LDDLDIRAVHAQDQFGAGGHCRADLSRIEGVDADTEALRDERGHDIAERGKRHARGAADVDDVRPRCTVVLSLLANGLGCQLRGVVDFGQDLDVERAVIRGGIGPAEVPRQLAQVLGSLLHTHAEPLPQDEDVPFTQPGQKHEVDVRWHLEAAGDP